MIAIRLEPQLVKQIDNLAKIKHSNRSVLIREAIIRMLEDEEDIKLAEYSKKHAKSTKTLKQIRKELGLDD
jgi:predicted DNA-binding protein